jgi:hypothetical protein
MALTKTVSKYGVEFASAYHRITNLDYYVNEYSMTQFVEQEADADGNPVAPVEEEVLTVTKIVNLTVRTYADADARTDLAEALASKTHSFTPDWDSTDNILTQGYAYLKTLSEFDSAIDS